MTGIFQNFNVYPQYLRQFTKSADCKSFVEFEQSLIKDRFLAMHMLKPVEDGTGGAFSIGNSKEFRRLWLSSKGVHRMLSVEETLLNQIEESKAEVFYNLDPVNLQPDFLKRLPGNIRKTVAWLAAPAQTDLSMYDLVVCNFYKLIQGYRDLGWRSEYFFPAFDEEMKKYRRDNRDIDVLFVGSYSQYHKNRRALLSSLAALRGNYSVRMHLHFSRFVKAANWISGFMPVDLEFAAPSDVRALAKKPVFGLSLYELLGRSKIVANMGIDFSGDEKGNMRCWESLGAQATLLTDAGNYPQGMVHEETIISYKNLDEFTGRISELIRNPAKREMIASKGAETIERLYNRDTQLKRFQELL